MVLTFHFLMENSLAKNRIEILLLFVLYLLILPRVYMDYDMGFWREWALYIHQHGLGNAYDNPGINYFPVYIYALYVYDLLQGTEAHIIHNINNIKLLFVFFDFLPVFVLCCFRQRLLSFRVPWLFLLLNIAYVFNSMVWGQIDSIYVSFSFLAILCGFSYPVLSMALYLLALNTKPQAIEFLPVIILALYYGIRNVRTLVVGIVVMVCIQLVLLLPFIAHEGVSKLVFISTHFVGRYHNLSICAFNIWYLIARGNPYFIDDAGTYLLVSYRTAGLLMFAASSVAILLPMARHIWQHRKEGTVIDKKTYEILFLGTGLLCLFFFYFNSQMHERYVHPIIIFFFFYSVVSGNYRLYILASIPYFLSLDKCFPDYLPIVHYKVIYASVVIAVWYTATVAYGSWLYYQLVRRQISPTGNVTSL